MEDRASLFTLRDNFINAFVLGQWQNKGMLFVDHVDISTSFTGKYKGLENIDKALSTFKNFTHCKVNVENDMLHINHSIGQHSFSFVACYVSEESQFHFLQLGMTFVLRYVKIQNQWKISSLKSDLCWVDGNTYWLRDWKLLDYHQPKRYQPVICADGDGVAIILPKNQETICDELKIKEALYTYGWIIDYEDVTLLTKSVTTDFKVIDGYHRKTVTGAKEWANFIHYLNLKEPMLHHVYRIRTISINGNLAKAKMSRLEPNRIKNKVIGSHNWMLDWFTLDYEVDLVCTKGKWKLQCVSFQECLYSEQSEGKFYHAIS